MVRVPDVREQSARVGEWRGGETTTQEPEHQDRSGVFGQGAADLKSGVNDKRADEHGSTAVGLGEGTPDEWTDAVPSDKERDG